MVNFYFLDSSALVKRYVPETGSAWVQSMTDTSAGNPIAIAQIAWVEVFSALSRRRREGTLSADELDIIGQKFRNEFENQYRVIEVDRGLLERARELVLQYPLRAYDAVQLASALRLQSVIASLPEVQLVFVSADDRLLDIAQTEALVTDNPNRHP